MSAKLFKECDSWGDSSNNSGEMSWSFKKTPKNKDKKNKQAKKRNHSAIDEDPEAGKYVRAPKYFELEQSDKTPHESPATKKINKRKRKHDKVESVNIEQSSDGITPEKKLKKQNGSSVAATESPPKSYAESLRENLKGSRFRFMNEQMYKQSGKESMEVFKQDETAFEAYHEGYRRQIAQWPMNPLDRIIKNIKKL